MSATEYALQEQFSSPERMANGAFQFEGADGIAAGDPAKFITLLAPADLVSGQSYSTKLETSGVDAQATRQSLITERRTIHTWTGAGFSAQSAIITNINAASGAWGAAGLSDDFSASGILLRFDSDKNDNAYFWWRMTMRLLDTSFPILP